MSDESTGARGMSRCPACGAENEAEASHCFGCGAAIAPALRPLVKGSVIAERYEVVARVGQGGMGVVYEAIDRLLEERVAVKVLRDETAPTPDTARRFRQELKLARRVGHPNVCRMFEYGEHEGRRFVVMELLEGQDLRRILQQHGPLPWREAFAACQQVSAGLGAIHQAGIIHRDLKTSNLVRTPDGTIKLMDFGIAKALGASSTGATATGSIMGTPEYMSPEQAKGLTVDHRSDLYSLAIVVFELFTGARPFDAETPVQLIVKHLSEPPALEPGVARGLPAVLLPVLERALAKDPAARHQSAIELAEAIRAAEAQVDLSAAPERGSAPTVALSSREVSAVSGAATATALATQPAATAETHQITARLPATAPQPAVTQGPGTQAAPMPPSRSAWLSPRGVLAIAALALAVIAGVRWLAPGGDAAPAGAGSDAPLVAPGVLVRIDALPWARVRVVAADGVPLELPELVTPVRLPLPPGRYVLELENDGLTPPFTREIEVGAEGPNDFVVPMPGFESGRPLQEAEP